MSAQRRLYVSMGVHPKLPCLWDATEGDVATSMDWTGMKFAVEGSEAIWERMRGGRTAILVADEADFGMGPHVRDAGRKHAAGNPRILFATGCYRVAD